MEESSTLSSFFEYLPDESTEQEAVKLSNFSEFHSSDSSEPEFSAKLNFPLIESTSSLISGGDDEIILSVYWKRGKLGAAYYTSHDSEIHILNDTVDVHPEFNNLNVLASQINPSNVLTCGGLPDSFIQSLADAVNGITEGHNENIEKAEKNFKKIYFMSSRKKDLSYESCKRYILNLRFGFEPENLSEEDHVLFVSSHIDLNQESMVISLGMLVKYLEKYQSQMNLKHDVIQIMFVNHITLNNLVSMDENTFKALQIFNPRVHPSAFKRNVAGLTKEGLSVFAIFNRCRSRAGVKKMKEIFMNPSKNIDELNERLDAVEFCINPQHQHIIQNVLDCIKKVESVSGILASIYRTRVNMSHWRSIYTSLYNMILIGEICRKHSLHSKLFEKVASSITHNVHEITHFINQVIDFEESTSRNHFTVRNGIDRKLDLLRETYAQIPDVLAKIAEIELEDLPNFIEQCSVVYITELGYLLSVPVWRGDGSDAAEYTLPNFEVKFIVNNYIHYKTPRCIELDSILGDSVASISDIESKIMISLIQFIHLRISDIVKAIKLVAELDCVIAFATVASENDYHRPVLTKNKEINIIKGRHPLQELCVDNFVPNDATFSSEGHYIKILTGPNASGKSVYLKQVALITYLAHIGSFVPAQSAQICILDHIHSRIQSVESISTRMSAFLLDLKQITHSIYNSTSKSLIIIDEFGKGTTEIDGLSLLASSLTHFIEREGNCPFILVSTHFYRLAHLLPPSPLVNSQYMDYLIENKEIIYLHKIKDGVSGSSLTYLAARSAGLSEDALKRSIELQNSVGHLKCNPKLKITKAMMREISFMEKIFELFLDE